jgi:hypothetical protein
MKSVVFILHLFQNPGPAHLLTSSIYECKIVATALMMSSTFGFSKVDPMKIELIVDDFLSSIVRKF